MTRGKEVQDFIKESKKSARERFEEAGWKVFEDRLFVMYVHEGKRLAIAFYFKKQYYDINFLEYIDYAKVGIDTHKLITYQLEELGWL